MRDDDYDPDEIIARERWRQERYELESDPDYLIAQERARQESYELESDPDYLIARERASREHSHMRDRTGQPPATSSRPSGSMGCWAMSAGIIFVVVFGVAIWSS